MHPRPRKKLNDSDMNDDLVDDVDDNVVVVVVHPRKHCHGSNPVVDETVYDEDDDYCD